MIQATGDIESSTLVEVDPGEGAAARLNVPIGIQHRHAAEGVVDVPLNHIARVVKERRDIIPGVLVMFAVASD